MSKFIRSATYLSFLASALAPLLRAQTGPVFHANAESRIIEQVDDRRLINLPHNTHPLARPEFDQGPAPADLPLNRMLLVLKRSPAQDAALKQLLEQQQDRSSPNYHKWLTPEEFGEQFGPSTQDIQVVTSWLRSRGFQVARVATARTLIEFSGTARQVEESFHTPIHKFLINGEEQWANANDQQLPAALEPVTAGIATLHNFQKKPQLHISDQSFAANYHAGAQPQLTAPNGMHALTPADFSVIYNVTPVNAVTNGGGHIAIVARSNINVEDPADFRHVFGLDLDSVGYVQVTVNGTDPGQTGDGDEVEAVLDSSWAGAVAKNALIDLVVSASTNSTDGVYLSEEYIIDGNTADIMSESYGGCEAEVTAAEANQIETLAEEAAAQGITYVVSSGDSGAALCDEPSSHSATGPLSVDVLASTPYTIAVGGTEFNEHGKNNTYWKPKNGTAGESAISYIPEDVWNQSCDVARCGNRAALWAGGGGASKLFSKPGWQTGVPGIPNDAARDLPDVSLTASGHDPYLICFRGSCQPNSQGQISLFGVAGTSASAPSFASILNILGAIWPYFPRQGQADYMLYRFAARQVSAQCNGSGSRLPGRTCIFNDVTAGNNAVPGEPGYGGPTAKYQATAGYDLATGLGSVNVGNLYKQYYQEFLNSDHNCCYWFPALETDQGHWFNPQQIGTASPASSVQLSDPWTVPLTITGLSLIGANASDFIVTNTCGSELPALSLCSILVQFVPTAPGPRTASLVIGYNSPYSPGIVPLTGTGVGQVSFGGEQPGDIQVMGDFDGDGQLDWAVWRPSNGFWYIYPSSSPGTLMEEQWGLAGDIPVPADYDGDGFTDYAVWRPSTGTWFILPSRTRTPYSWQWGMLGDIPVTGDYDGDGKADLVLWRPSNQTWFLTLSGSASAYSYQWGLPGDVPVAGDFDGSGKQEIAVWRPSDGIWYVISAITGAPFFQQWGLPGDVPVAVDFDGDGKTDYAVWRPSDENLYILPSSDRATPYRQQSGVSTDLVATKFNTPSIGRGVYMRVSGDFDGDGQLDSALWNPVTGLWFVIPSSNPGAPIQLRWGQLGDVPVAGDFDGDGKTDFAIWRPSTGQWWIVPSSNPGLPYVEEWGVEGDIPVAGDYDGDGKTDLAVWRPSTGQWWIIPSSNPGAPYIEQWGVPGDIPVPGDYDGLGKTNLGVWRPSSGLWYVVPSNGTSPYTKQMGSFGDVPLACDFEGNGKADFGLWRPSDQSNYVISSAQASEAVQLSLGLTGNTVSCKQPR